MERIPPEKLYFWGLKFSSREIRTRDGWVRSLTSSSVLCHSRSIEKMIKFLSRLTCGFLFEKRIQQLQYLNSPEQEDHFFVMRMKIQNPRQIFFRWWLPKFLQLENLNIRKSTSYSRPFVVLSWDCFTKIHTGNKIFFSAAVRMQNLKWRSALLRRSSSLMGESFSSLLHFNQFQLRSNPLIKFKLKEGLQNWGHMCFWVSLIY